MDAPREVVGRKFQATWFQLSRRLVGEDRWIVISRRYNSLEEAKEDLSKIGQRCIDAGGGILVDTGPADMLLEFRITRVVADSEVLHTEMKMI